MSRARSRAIAAIAVAALTLTGCATSQSSASETTKPSTSSVTVEDNNGSQTISLPLTSVVATDNRTFETLESWGVELSAAAVALMPSTIGYKKDDSIIDLCNHNEPDLEALVAVEPQLVVNGQRFTQFHDDIAKLAPDAVVLELDPREGQPLDAELKRQVTVLGEVFGKQAEAKKLADDLDAAVARVKAAYDPSQTVMAVTTSGGEIGYIAPKVGRTLGPLFDLLGLTPALEVEGATDDHQGDDISVEAIAEANPDWILVLDRDAGANTEGASSAQEIIAESEALANVTAIQEGNIIYLNPNFYTAEDIQHYTELFNQMADAFEGQ